jgi:succinate dehydrogenase / fumarate reductase, cytochrome b subunit
MPNQARPLSPHLQIYRPQLTTALSIVHRGTGIFLAFGSVLLVAWLLALAASPDAYNSLRAFSASAFGTVLLIGLSYALAYHLLNGLRHLGWDAGYGLDITTTYKTGWTVVVLSVLLTIAIWTIVLFGNGAAP